MNEKITQHRIYMTYNSPMSRRQGNQNNLDNIPVSVFPRNIYDGETMGGYYDQPFRNNGLPGTTLGTPAEFVPRDVEMDYFIDPTHNYKGSDPTIKNTHPSHFSRFGYKGCPNGYCTGNHPGRYNTAPDLMNKTRQPPNMAPIEFYNEHLNVRTVNVNSFYDETRQARNYL